MKEVLLKGIITANVTPFTKRGQLYEKGLREVVEFQIEKGIHGLFVCGTAGQGPLMTVKERRRVASIVIDQVAGRIPVIVHVGSLTTEAAVRLTRDAAASGAVAVGSVPPFYYHPDMKGIYQHFEKIANASDLPVFVYHNPGTTGTILTPEQIERLAEIANVRGLKDAGGNLGNLCKVMKTLQDFTVIVASSTLALAALAMGAAGAISSVSGVIPEPFVALYSACMDGDLAEAAALQKKMNELSAPLRRPTITALHEGLKLRGVDAGYTRGPLRMADPHEIDSIRQVLSKHGMLG